MTPIIRPVLDHGYVELLNIAGPVRRPDQAFDAHDMDPALSARMSFGKAFIPRTVDRERKLNEYLMVHEHTTPFEMIEVWMVMKLPIFVARQFVRHRTVSINEISGRYITLPEEWYIPRPEHVGIRPEHIKQGRLFTESEGPPAPEVTRFLQDLKDQCHNSYQAYLRAINDNIPPEVARNLLHLNHYTIWLWKQDFHNLIHFLKKRLGSGAQWEARQYGTAVEGILSDHLPNLMDLFRRHKLKDAP